VSSIIMGTSSPDILSSIANSTGGKIYSNIIRESEFNEAFLNISYNLSLEPCELTWRSGAKCQTSIKIDIENKTTALSSNTIYEMPDSKIIRLFSEPYFINFGSINKGETRDTIITITAVNSDNTIRGITFEPDNSYYELNNSLPIEIKSGKSIDLSIKYTAIETSRQYTKMNLISDYCESSVGLLGGNSNRPIAQRTLELTFPNGGEVFNAGIDTIITWKGISEQENVNLNFSSNNGKDWKSITKSTSDLIDNWKLPQLASDSCLININLLATEDKPSAIEWSKTYGGSNLDIVNSVYPTADGGCIVAGYSFSDDGDLINKTNFGKGDCWIIKLRDNGIADWSMSYGGSQLDVASSVYQTLDNGYVLAGSTQSVDGDLDTLGNKGSTDYWVVKLQSSGQLEWMRTYGGSRNEEPKSIIQTFEGGYIVAGRSTSNDGDVGGEELGLDDFWILKLFETGEVEWSKKYGGSNFEIASSIVQTSDAGYLIAGNSQSTDRDLQ
ncbi:MAG: hypothetical protein RIF34_02540, partial [Candidatus Kapaibacterium sp.]